MALNGFSPLNVGSPPSLFSNMQHHMPSPMLASSRLSRANRLALRRVQLRNGPLLRLKLRMKIQMTSSLGRCSTRWRWASVRCLLRCLLSCSLCSSFSGATADHHTVGPARAACGEAGRGAEEAGSRIGQALGESTRSSKVSRTCPQALQRRTRPVCTRRTERRSRHPPGSWS